MNNIKLLFLYIKLFFLNFNNNYKYKLYIIRRWDNNKIIYCGIDIFFSDLLCKIIKNRIDLSYADFSNKYNLSNTNFRLTNIYKAKFNNSYLNYCKFTSYQINNVIGINDNCPKTGSFIGWKKCKFENNYYIVKLKILIDSKRCSDTRGICRCNKAEVLEILNLDLKPVDIPYVLSFFDNKFTYIKGQIVYSKFDSRPWVNCSYGIYFFTNINDAINFKYTI